MGANNGGCVHYLRALEGNSSGDEIVRDRDIIINRERGGGEGR